jgi:hypothetical protein
VHPNLDPTLGVDMGVKGVYCSIWEVRVGKLSKISHRKLKNSISHNVVILAPEPDALLRITVLIHELFHF